MYSGFQSYVKSFFNILLAAPLFIVIATQAQTSPENTFVSISLGGEHGCALTEVGSVKCWGNNQFGQLGIGNSIRYTVQPVTVDGLSSGVLAVTVGTEHSCALLSGRTVKCWGNNSGYQLGDSTSQPRYTPVDVVGLGSNIISVAAAGAQTCALTDQGVVRCWGYHNLSYKTSPTDILGFGSGIIAITAGTQHVCGITTSSTVKCAGYNSNGQIGDGTTTSRSSAVDVAGLDSVVRILAGGTHTCALTLSGAMYCWGNNTYGQLGDGTQVRKLLPTLVSGNAGIYSDLTAAVANTCGLGVNGAVQCWGANNNGQLGNNTKTNSFLPTDVLGLTIGTSKIDMGSSFGCAISLSGGLNCWGDNLYGKLSDGSTTERLLPSPINQTNDSVAITCVAVPFAIGASISGFWGQDGDCTTGIRGSDFKTDSFSFWGGAGQLISIEAISSAFNAFIYLRDPMGRVIAYDNDGYYNPVSTSTPNSRIPAKWGTFVLPATGTYTIEVTSSTTSNPNPNGSYQIITRTYGLASSSYSSGSSSVSSISSITSTSASSVISVSASSTSSSVLSSRSSSSFSSSSSVNSSNAGVCVAIDIALNINRTGQLSSADCKSGVRGSNYYTDRYNINGMAGQQVYINLTSTAFDTYLYLRSSNGSALAANDDGGGGTDSRIPASSGYYMLPASGNFIIEVTSYSSLKTGSYALFVGSLQ